MINNKRGWIKIIEAFTAILIIMSILLVVINKEYAGKSDASAKIYEIELTIIQSVVVDDALKSQIFSIQPAVNLEYTTPPEIQTRIEESTPSYLTCVGLICEETGDCNLGQVPGGKDIYTQSIILREEVVRKLKLFCWMK